eukprot:gene9330-11443_t
MGDASNLLKQSYTLIQQATIHDRNHNYQEALRLYLTGLEGFVSALKIEKNDRVKTTLKAKMAEYMDRAEQLKVLISKGRSSKSSNHADECCTHNSYPSPPVVAPHNYSSGSSNGNLVLPSVPSDLPGGGFPHIVTPSAPILDSPPQPPQQSIRPSINTPTTIPSIPTGTSSIKIEYGQIGCSYDNIFGKYLIGGNSIYFGSNLEKPEDE